MPSFWFFAKRRRLPFKIFIIVLFFIFCYLIFRSLTSYQKPQVTNKFNLPQKIEVATKAFKFQDKNLITAKSIASEILTKHAKHQVTSKKNIVKEEKDGIMSVTPGLGEKGAPVILSKEEQVEADKLFKEAAFNVYISNRISLNRSVPDPRNSLCQKVRYDEDLPTASVIIIFTDEVWSALLRTIYSVVNRTPKRLLKEIILVDDYSSREELKKKLDLYVEKHFPPGLLKILRMEKREGLIRARLAGARAATGDVLIFLDSHCEANQQWAEPLLQRVKAERKAVLCPIIDVIDDNTLEYYAYNGDYFQIGGFTWNGHFNWIEIPVWEEQRRHSAIAPARTPTMAGGLFAIDRKYFWEIGSYDEGMDIWGGENLEMSFRVWMCGGILEIVPCSHVGHIFRNYHPYTFPGNKDTHGINTVRTVEVWMEGYRRYFYLHRPDLQNTEYGDISSRLKLKKDLKCKSFEWYLKNIYPQKFIPDQNVQAYGTVRNPVSHLCLDTLNANEEKTSNLGLYTCNSEQGVVLNQFFSLTNSGELRREETCVEVQTRVDSPALLTKCVEDKPEQKFIHKKGGPIANEATGFCLEVVKQKPYQLVFGKRCTETFFQIWWFETYTDININLKFHSI